jgi:hypothetical protein
MRMRYVACFSTFFRIIAQAGRFSGEKLVEYKMRVLIFSATFVCKIFLS